MRVMRHGEVVAIVVDAVHRQTCQLRLGDTFYHAPDLFAARAPEPGDRVLYDLSGRVRLLSAAEYRAEFGGEHG